METNSIDQLDSPLLPVLSQEEESCCLHGCLLFFLLMAWFVGAGAIYALLEK